MLHGRGVAIGGGISEIISLSGGINSPNESFDISNSPDDALTGWRFNTDGTVDFKFLSIYTKFGFGTEWNNVTPGLDYWIRFTANSGEAATGGSAHDSWLKLAGSGQAARTILWDETSNFEAETDGSDKVEISTDSGGVTVVATGYYGGNATVFGDP